MERALKAPLTAIINNSGESELKIIDELKAEKKGGAGKNWVGFNATTNKIVSDLRETGIIDPLKVTKTAFTNAISVASNYLTIGAAVTNLPEKKEDHGHEGGGANPMMGY